MFSRERINSFISLANAGGICGWLLLVRPVMTLVFSRQRDLKAYSAVDASAMIFIVYACICFYYSVRELNLGRAFWGRKVLFSSPLTWFLAYSVYGVISIFWSVNLPLTGFRAFECLSMMFLMVVILQNLFESKDIDTIIDWTILFVTVDIVFSILLKLKYTFNFFEILQSSQMMATVFFYMALYYVPKSWWHYLILILSIFSMSTVAYIGMAMGCISTFFGQKRYRIYAFFGAFALGIVITVVGPYKFVKDTVFFDKKEISVHETTGRDKIMNVAIQALSDKPEGYGFFAGEPYLLYSKRLGAINGHNSLFSAAIGLGVPGIILISIFFIMMSKATFSRYMPTKYRASLIGCFIVGFLQCMGNPGIGSRIYGGWIPVMFVFTLICGFYVNGKYYDIYEETEETIDEE